ncbi:hypothetical protein ABK040_014866 [Willaertia magna]
MLNSISSTLLGVLQDLDRGLSECCLYKTKFNTVNLKSNREIVEFFLKPFAESSKYKALELTDLIEQFSIGKNDKEQLLPQMSTISVVRWIFYSNKIEEAGMESEEETLSVVIKGKMHVTEKNEKEVIQMYELLVNTYKPENLNGELSNLSFDTNSLLKWNKTMLLGILSESEMGIRKSGVETLNLDGTTHYYPNHKIVPDALLNLCTITHRLMKAIPVLYTEPANRVLYTFALAAFVQFHFVDIHPFYDGNGRMCRFLSKRVLDYCCPVPFPMFKDKGRYFEALVKGRTVDASVAPMDLLFLLLESAVDHYREMINTYLQQPYDILVAATENEMESEISNLNIDLENRQKLVEVYKEKRKEAVENIDIKVGNVVYRLKTLPLFSFDSL